jgi:molecular chaperone DnaK (HSP70)
MPDPRHICAQCSAWHCASDDAWCGYCGAPCAELQLTIRPSVFLVDHIPPKVCLQFTNPTCTTVQIQKVSAPDWITFEGDVRKSLAPGEPYTLWATAQTFDMEEPQAGQIAVQTSVGDAISTVMVIEEEPILDFTPREIEIWSGAGSTRQRIPLTIAPRLGDLRISNITPGSVEGLTVITKIDQPWTASAATELAIALEANGDILARKSYASLLVHFDGPHGTKSLEMKLAVAARNPPQLSWTGEDEQPRQLFQTSQQHMRLALKNQVSGGFDGGLNNGKLILESVTLKAPNNCAGAIVQLLSPLPIEVPGGEERTVDFELNFENISLSKPELFHFDLEVRTNGPRLRKPVPLDIHPLQEFDGVLAIDFGSSNTSCAVVEVGCDHEEIRLEEDTAVSPTYIQYLDLSGPEPKTEIGSRVKRLSSIDAAVSASTVSGLKQQLGEPEQLIKVRPENSEKWLERKITDAVADYLHQVRYIAESRRNVLFHDFMLTHPAVCSLIQFRNLNTALTDAFGAHSENVHFMQEPIAALIPFIMDMASKPQQPSYTVASFDLGGGTTDIAVVRVHHAWNESGSVEIRPQILSCRGVRFGGENLTDYLEQKLRDRCDDLLGSEGKKTSMVRPDMAGVSTSDININKSKLRDAAEKFKISLNRDGKKDALPQLILRVQKQDRTVGDFNFDFDELNSIGKRNLEREFLDYTRDEIRKMAKILDQCGARAESIQYIHISGKTAVLPVVRETLQRLYPSVEIVLASNPKECVVTGACLSLSMSRGKKRRLILSSGLQRTTSSLGVFDNESRTFTPILPVDTEIPAEGLQRDLAGYWYGAEPVTIWENLGLDDGDIEASLGDKLLYKLATWRPGRKVIPPPAVAWALRLTLKNFELAVSAVGPNGEIIQFRQTSNAGHS